MIEYQCPSCGAQMASPVSMAGQSDRCPECGNVARVPQSAPQAPTHSSSTNGDPVLWYGGPSHLAFLASYIGAVLLLALGLGTLVVSLLAEEANAGFLLAVGICLLLAAPAAFLPAWLRQRCTPYLITERHVRVRSGVLTRYEGALPIEHIRAVTVTRSLQDRLFGLATVGVASATTTGVELHFQGIRAADAVRATIEKQRRILSPTEVA